MQTSFIPDLISADKLPTNLTTDNHPIHRWYNFIAGFSPEFIQSCINEARLNGEHRLLDPFAGSGTSLVQASLAGVGGVGFEAHPFFYDLAYAKTTTTYSKDIVSILIRNLEAITPFTGELSSVWEESALKFLTKLVPEKELRFLANALFIEKEVELTIRPLYRLIVSRILEATSSAQTDGIYKAPTSKKQSISYHQALQRVASMILTDITLLEMPFQSNCSLFPQSSERMTGVENDSCDLCVTSPPYLNNFDFAEMTRMELYYWKYASSWKEITEKVRRNLIVNTTTVPIDLKRQQERFANTLSQQMQSRLSPIVSDLNKMRHTHAGKKEYDLLVYPYFAQIQAVFAETQRVLKRNNWFHLIVANSALYGVHIPTEELLSQLMKEVGFEVVSISNLRSRGDRWILHKRKGSKQGLGEYHIKARKL